LAVPPDSPVKAVTAGAGWPAVPGYEILDVLARGGQGVVYRARHRVLGRLVALKVLLSGGHAGPAELQRFRTEAEAVARLQHPHVVQIYEVGEHDGLPYLALEYLEGGSLAQKLQGTPLPPPETARLVETLARAVGAAHQRGIVHRDLKPANVLLTADSTPKVTDFGLAKKLDAAGPTATGAILGTPSYMAPEQAENRGQPVGPAADVYALGAILYELLTGRPPFQAATPMDTIMQVMKAEPVPPRRLQPKLPRDLETVCLKCLQKEPTRRYASALALADDLERFRQGRPLTARPVGVAERGWRWCRRNPLAVAVVASLLVGTVVATYFAVQAAAQAVEADANARRANEEADRTRQAKQVSDQRLYVADMRLAERAWEDNSIGRLLELLEGQQPEHTDGVDLRGFEWHYWWRRCHAELLRLDGHAAFFHAVAYSPDGRRLATGSHEGARVWDAATGQELLSLLGHPNVVFLVAYSPDGRRLATASAQAVRRKTSSGEDFSFEGGTTVRIWDGLTGQELLSFKGRMDFLFGLVYSPDGRRLATASQEGAQVWDAATGQELLSVKGPIGTGLGVAFSPDGRRLATASHEGARVWDAATGQELLAFKGHRGSVHGVAYSPDGRRLATASADRTARVWDAATGQPLLTCQGHAGEVHSVAFSSDGRHLATAAEDQTARVWDAATGQQLLALKGQAICSQGLAYSPDGRHLATAGSPAQVWSTVPGQESLIFRGHMAAVRGVAFDGDGRRLATASDDGTAWVWDAATGQQLLILEGHKSTVTGVAFRPNRGHLATTAADGKVRVWDASTGRQILAFEGHKSWVNGVAYSPDGRRLATAPREGSVRVWDADTGQELLALKGNPDEYASVAYSPDGRRLAAGSGSMGGDHAVRVWDAVTGEELLALRGHEGPVDGVAYSPDGCRLATASRDGTGVGRGDGSRTPPPQGTHG
jgi:WD40 repeat protein